MGTVGACPAGQEAARPEVAGKIADFSIEWTRERGPSLAPTLFCGPTRATPFQSVPPAVIVLGGFEHREPGLGGRALDGAVGTFTPASGVTFRRADTYTTAPSRKRRSPPRKCADVSGAFPTCIIHKSTNEKRHPRTGSVWTEYPHLSGAPVVHSISGVPSTIGRYLRSVAPIWAVSSGF
jgi:hypothetical protein